MTLEIGLLISMIGCFVALAGWLANREKRVCGDAEWRGCVNAKLDVIVGIKDDLTRIEAEVRTFGERLARAEAGIAQAHRRMDEQNGIPHSCGKEGK